MQQQILSTNNILFIEEKTVGDWFVIGKYSNILIIECVIKCNHLTLCKYVGYKLTSGDKKFIECYLIGHQSAALETAELKLQVLVDYVSNIFQKQLPVAQSCSVKKVFLVISQNSQENTCARVSFLIKLEASTCN